LIAVVVALIKLYYFSVRERYQSLSFHIEKSIDS
jgi:hypothetical protein